MTDRKPLSAHERLSADALIARLDKAIPLATAAKLGGDEAWLRYYRECLEVLLQGGQAHAQKFMSMIEPRLSDQERNIAASLDRHRWLADSSCAKKWAD